MSNQGYTRKYLIMGSQNVPAGKDAEDLLRKAIQAGVTAFEFRELGKDQLFGLDKIKLGTELRRICKQQGIPFIVYNDVEMLKLLDADGIRVTGDYGDLNPLRKQFPDKLISMTMTSGGQEGGGQLALVDFIAAGPVYEDLPDGKNTKPTGLGLIKQLSSTYQTLNVVAFGGIDQTNAKEVMDAGASGVAVISAVTEAGESMEDAVSKL